MSPQHLATGSRAVVIGAGIGGLTAAGALAGHFDQVIVLERDALPAAPAPRAGTPQAHHVHGLLAGGLQAMAELFPGIGQNLLRAGALPDPPTLVHWPFSVPRRFRSGYPLSDADVELNFLASACARAAMTLEGA